MTAKKNVTNGHNKHNGHVSLAREEYDAFVAREESHVELSTENARNVNRLHEVTQVVSAQAKYLSETDLKVAHLERVNGLQATLIDALRIASPKVAAMEDLSEFWRQWIIHTGKAVDEHKATRDEVIKLEPDLFKTWRNWVFAAGRVDRTFGEAGSRMSKAEYEAARPKTQGEMQEHVIRRLREENMKLITRANQLEEEIKVAKEAQSPQDNQQKEKRP